MHKAKKISRSNEVIDISKRPTKCAVNILGCSKHNDLAFDYYCVDHDDLCCKECLAVSHRTCSKVISVDVASQGITESQSFTDVIQQIQQILETVALFTTKKDENLDRLTHDIEKAKDSIKDTKAKLMQHLESLEEALLQDLTRRQTVAIKMIKEDMSEIQGIEKCVTEHKETIDLFVNHGSEKHIFLLTHTFRAELGKVKDKMKGLTNTSKSISIDCKANNCIEKIDLIGAIFTTEILIGAEFKPMKERQSQIPVHMRYMINESDIRSIYTECLDHEHCHARDGVYSNINGMILTENDLLFICDGANCRLVVTSEQEYNHISMEHKPWDIAITFSGKCAVVTSVEDDIIQIVNTHQYKVVEKMILEGTHQGGITATRNQIYIGGKNLIYICNNKIDIIKKIPTHFSPWHMYLGEQHRMYCSDEESFYCINLDNGKQILKYKSENLWSPGTIVMDNNGIVYVLGCYSFNLLRLKPDGTFLDIIMQEKDGMHFPTSMCFNHNYTKLYVAYSDGPPFISVYTLT